MVSEIELKFILQPACLPQLLQWLTALSFSEKKEIAVTQLTNTYYDTKQYYLRQQHIALRVRGDNGQFELTVKHQGKMCSGIMQRPEYTVSLLSPVLDLSQLPQQALPIEIKRETLQRELIPLFCTNFSRKTLLIEHLNSQIEIALDEGIIESEERQLPILELELELKKGSHSALLSIAQQLSEFNGLRLSEVSKAHRGYQLVYNQPITKKTLIPLSVPDKSNIEQALVYALQYALNYWQQQEEIALMIRSVQPLLAALQLLRQCFQLWGSVIPRKASSKLRQQLEQIEQKLMTLSVSEKIDNVVYQTDYLATRLALLIWLEQQAWKTAIDSKQQAKLYDSFKRFADKILVHNGAELKRLFKGSLSLIDYQQKAYKLQGFIFSLYLLSGAYEPQALLYIDGWLHVLNAIRNNKLLVELQHKSKKAMAQKGYWLR